MCGVADTRVGRYTLRPLMRLGARWILYARSLPILRRGRQEVMPGEELQKLIAEAREIAVIPCACRTTKRTCAHPMHKPHEADTCLSFGVLATFQIMSGVGRRLTREEAEQLCRRGAESGMVHHAIITLGSLAEACNCCSESCGILAAWRHGIRRAVRASGMVAVRGAACDGCRGRDERICVEVCPYTSGPGSADCVGCGLCGVQCPSRAIELLPRLARAFELLQ